MTELLHTIMGVTPTAQQRDAITMPRVPYLILAGAGTGKTTVMSARIAWLVAEGHVAPERILGLTFTTKAAGELAARVRRDLHSVSARTPRPDALGEAEQPTVSTYNAFGARLLREHAVRIGVEPDSRMVVDALRYQLGFRVIATTAVDLGAVGYDPRSALSDLLAMDEALAHYLLDPEMVAAGELEIAATYEPPEGATDLQRTMVETCRKRAALCQVVQEFRDAKVGYDAIDYSDQVRLAARAAETSQAMRDALRSQYDIVLLDEYQDTSVSQRVLLQRLFGDGFPVTAVGDPLQSIYRWRGAEITNMSTFPMDFPEVDGGHRSPSRVLPLSENWRSTQEILDIANDISTELRERHDALPLTAGRTDLPPTRIEAVLLPRLGDEFEWLAQRLRDIGQSESWRDMAVLMREKKNLGALVRALENAGVPVQLADAGALFELPEVREVIAYLQILADPTDNPALARILAGPRWMIGSRDLEVLGDRASQLAKATNPSHRDPIEAQLDHIVAGTDYTERVSLLDALEQTTGASGQSTEAVARMNQLADELRGLRRYVGDPLPELVGRVVRTTGLGVESLIRAQPNGASRYDRLAMLFDLVSGFSDIDGRAGLDAFLSYVRDCDRFDASVAAELPLTTEAVTVMSIHKAKGLEYPIVALPGLCKGTFPSTTSDKYWPGNAHVLPQRYLPGDQPADLVRLPGEVAHLKADLDAHTAHIRAERAQDEDRLAYVAVTRAAHHLLASGSWWGPTQSQPRGPSPYLEAVKQHATHVGHWEGEPTDKRNPFLEAAQHPVWPADPDPAYRDACREQGAMVRAALADLGDQDSGLTEAEKRIVAEWDTDIAAVREQVRQGMATTRAVRLPDALTASQVVAMRADPAEFLAGLVRPMPQRPSRAAERGTAFHTWVEVFYGDRALVGIDDLDGAVDDEIYSDAELEKLKSAFQAGAFALRTPIAIEEPFVIVVAGRTWRGRIDAVFNGTAEQADAPGRWLVVDWKTGPVGSADPIQLDIYRHAWARQAQVPVEAVAAAFYFVAQDLVEPLREPRSFEELEALF